MKLPRVLKASLIACSIPGAIIALVATVSAGWHWGGLSFSNPIYYATLLVAAWCPVSKIVVWRLWQREVELCLTCIPAKFIERRMSPNIRTTNGPEEI